MSNCARGSWLTGSGRWRGLGPKPGSNYVFHGVSGFSPEEIREAVSYGMVKMNIDTDTQYALTGAVASHVSASYDRVLKLDGGVGRKQACEPRSWGRVAQAPRVIEACEQLGSASRSLFA